MCFSPEASFSAAIVLTGTGTAAIRLAPNRPYRVLAGIPVIFGVQQFAEGMLWLSLLYPGWAAWRDIAMYCFLIIAQAVWPFYVPLAISLAEYNQRRARILRLLTGTGLIFSAYSLFALYQYPVSAAAADGHIRYDLGYALSRQWYYGLLYFIPTILAPLCSGRRQLRWLGYLFLASYILSRLFFHVYVISVWCFFGALISFLILWMVYRSRERDVK